MKLLNETDALAVTGGTSLKGYLNGYTYSQLVEAFGEPTFTEPTGVYGQLTEGICGCSRILVELPAQKLSER